MRKKVFLIILIIAALFVSAVYGADIYPAAGYYNQDQKITIKSDKPVYFFFEESSVKKPLLLESSDNIILTALNNEERKYTIVLQHMNKDRVPEESRHIYIINKKTPLKPEILKDSSNRIIFKSEKSKTVYYKTDNNQDWIKWDSIPIDAEKINVIFACTMNKAGNKSEIISYFPGRSLISAPMGSLTDIEIINPPEGNYYNRQILSLNTAGFEYIVYSFDKNLPLDRWIKYEQPVLIDKNSSVTVYFKGKHFLSDNILEKQLNYVVNEKNDISVSFRKADNNWIYTAQSDRRIEYSLSLKNPQTGFNNYLNPVVFSSAPGKNNIFSLNIRNFNDNSRFVYRFFIEDNQIIPEKPDIRITETESSPGEILLEILSESRNIFYTLDGTMPDSSSAAYFKPVPVKLPADKKEGKLEIRAIVQKPDSRKSKIAEYVYKYDTTVPEAPEAAEIAYTGPGNKRILLNNDDYDYIFSVSSEGTEQLPPDHNSLSIRSFIDLNVPFGSNRSFDLSIAAINKNRFISAPLIIKNLSVNHYPPDPPLYELIDNQIVLKNPETESADNRIFYVLKSDKTVFRHTWKEYTAPVPFNLLPDFSDNLEIEYYSVDTSGTKSRNRISLIQAGNYYPGKSYFAELIGDGIFYSDIDIEINQNESDIIYYFTVSDNLKAPADPEIKTDIPDRLILSAEENNKKHYTVKVLPYNKKTGNKGAVEHYSVVINRKVPEMPVIDKIPHKPLYSAASYLNIRKQDINDTVYYTYTTDNTVPDNPFNGEMLDKSFIRIDIPQNSRKKIRLSLGVESISSRRAVFNDAVVFTMDSRSVPVPTVSGIPPGNILNKDISVILEKNEGFITRYELAGNLQNISAVTHFSPVLEDKLVLSAKDNQTVAYILRIRNYRDIYDTAGSNEKIYHIIVDKTLPEIPVLKNPVKDIVYSSYIIEFEDTYNTVYYRISRNRELETDSFIKYNSPSVIRTQNAPAEITLEFYSLDAAGNKSKTDKYSFYLAENIIFVSEKGSNDNSGQDPLKPVKTIDHAFSKLSEKKADAIFIDKGSYIIDSDISLDKNILIKGMEGETTLTTSISGNNVSINLINSNLILKDIAVKTEKYNSFSISGLNSLVFMDNVKSDINGNRFVTVQGSLFIIESDISMRGRDIPGIFQISRGRVLVEKSSINLESSGSGTVFSLKDSETVIMNSFIDIIAVSGSSSAVNIINSTLGITNSVIKGSSPDNIYKGVVMDSAKTVIKDSFLFSSGMEAYSVFMRDSDLAVKGSRIDNRESRVSYGIYSLGTGSVILDNSRLNNSDSRKSNGVSVQDADVADINSTITGWDNKYFLLLD